MTDLGKSLRYIAGVTAALACWTVAGGGAIAQANPAASSPSFLGWLLGNRDNQPPYGDGDGHGPRPLNGGACTVSLWPGQVERIWHDRPVFLIQGPARSLAVFANNSNTPLWTYPLNDQAAVIYGGPALVPGQVYTLRIQDAILPDSVYDVRQFQLVTAVQQRAIANGLATAVAAADADGGSVGDVAIARANYFWAQGLGVDAWREMAIAQQLSPIAAEAMAFAYRELCDLTTEP